MATPVVSELFLYPVKSCRGVPVTELHYGERGPAGDRRWLVTEPGGRFLTQREWPAMARIAVAADSAGLELSGPLEPLRVPVPDTGEPSEVQVWDDHVEALDAGAEAAAWLSSAIGTAARLVYMPEDARRMVDPAYARHGELVSFADGFPTLLLSRTAVELLNEKLARAVSVDRFRPNIVIEGCEPHAEDGWQRLRINGVEFTVAKPCARCVMPAIDQRSGEKDSEILRVLAGYRRFAAADGSRQVLFGQNLLHTGSGRVRVGDPVELLA